MSKTSLEEIKFPIPKLDQEQWDNLQNSLRRIGNMLDDINSKNYKRYVQFIDIELGMIDAILGRTIPLSQLKNIKK